MTDESVDCFNCGASNPEWAQVCRSCGVALRHGEARIVPTERVPTDRDSLLSIGAVIGTILAAVLIGLFISGLNPTDPSVARATPTPTPSPTPDASSVIAPPSSEPVAPTETPAPVASATPALPGTLAFGSTLNQDQTIADPTDTFTPGTVFAHAITMTEPFGVPTIREQIVRINDDGSEAEVVPADENNEFQVDPAGTQFGVRCCDAATFVAAWGPGLYEMRAFAGDQLIARGQFRLAEG